VKQLKIPKRTGIVKWLFFILSLVLRPGIGYHAGFFFMNPTVAITGGIACGKSLFASFLTEAGCEILDADDVARRLQAPGGAALAPIRAAFGGAVFDAEGCLDRAALASVVFADPTARRKLEALVHPLVRAEFDAWRAKPSATPRAAVVPLLFEVDWQRDWPDVTCLASSAELQMQRLLKRGLWRP